MASKFKNQNLKQWPEIPVNETDIRIENNQLEEIPDSIGSLKSLTRIIASNNNISKVSKQIASLPNFTDLRLPQNNLSQIPDTIFGIKKLNVFIINDNNIERIDREIGRLSALTQLHLQNNSLKTLPVEIGQLTNLTHLFLDGNPIENLPTSIQNLKKLVHLSLSDTKLLLPPNFQPNQDIPATIQFILEHQKELQPTLNIKNAFVFENFSKKSLQESFSKVLEQFSEKFEVSFTKIIDLKSIDQNTNTVLIIVGFDVHNDQKLIFRIINKCNSLNIPYKVLYQKDTESVIADVNLEKGPQTELLRKKLESEFYDELISFNSKKEFEGLILSVLKEHKPEVILNSMRLQNIGHFEDVVIEFDNQLTCIVGENGQGKSSILRALSLAIVGSDNSKVSKTSLNNLLRIKSISKEGQINYCDSGSITLNYFVDSEEFQNSILFNCKDEGRFIDVNDSGDFELNSGEFNLKSLMVGFPQLRGKISQDEKIDKSPYSQPHVNDLMPLLNNSDDNRLDSFISWITNLYGAAIKESNAEESRDFLIIKYVFEIISDLTGKKISFLTVQNFTPPVVIVSSPDSPNGIPLNLISQGFKIVIGWIGYFVQRIMEAFPLSSPSASSTEKSILIIDEIDSSIHPIWQSRLLNVLRKKFPYTQIICTTHSPIMLAGLDRQQILEIRTTGNKVHVQANEFDTWVTSYRDILQMIFNTSDFIPTITKEELELQLEELAENPTKQEEIKETLNQLISNEIAVDDLKRYEKNLKAKEKELDDLIEEYKSKSK